MPGECHWTEESEGIYETDCGEAFTIIEGTPKDNSMRFCCYCGGVLIAVPYTDVWKDDDDA